LVNSNQIGNFNIGGKTHNIEISSFTKSVLNFRFFFLYIIVRNIVDQKLINIKILSLITVICSVILSLSIFLQHLIGFDFLGNKPFDGRYNGLFEHEAIAGGYIQKFFLLSIIYFFLFEKKNFSNFILITIFINILGLGILLSLDRMPYLIFIFSIIILLLFLKNHRIKLFSSLILIILIFLIFFNNYDILRKRYLGLVGELQLEKIVKLFSNKVSKSTILIINDGKNEVNNNNFNSDYLKIYNSAFHVFLINPFLGNGLKSFAQQCNNLNISSNNNLTCSTHPHNIYLEILVNQGIVGFLLFTIFIIILINKNYYKNIFSKITAEKKLLTIFFFSILISELTPIRSYGSIFQTINGSIFWFFLAILSSKIPLKK
jgi:hypothetical protein